MAANSNLQISNTRVMTSKVAEYVAPTKDQFRIETEVQEALEYRRTTSLSGTCSSLLIPVSGLYIRFDFRDDSDESPVIGLSIARVVESNNSSIPARVAESNNSSIPEGALVISSTHWAEYSYISQKFINNVVVLDNVLDPRVPLSAYNGVLGVSGFIVWDSLKKIRDLKKSETLYISSAAAKRKDLRVIESAGTNEKVAFLKKQHGLDAIFNCKTQDKRAALAEAVGGTGSDIYYDLIGDNTTEIVLDFLNPHGRVIAVGILSYHQNKAPAPLPNIINFLIKRLRYE
ncbi:hypothetical protein BGX28_008676 [Mortierella sp. GBA30]|nr:hypothetical protein BGX28_008676 [Mortierella sp. GBA30]